MQVILHDLNPDQWETFQFEKKEDDAIVSSYENANYCIGCFGCWLKTPATCIIADKYQHMGELLEFKDQVCVETQKRGEV